MPLDKEEIDKLLQGERTKGRQATEEERTTLHAELVKLIQVYKETNKRQMMKEITSLIHSLDVLNVKVVSEDEKMIYFELTPVNGQQYRETFFCRVEKNDV